MKINNINYIHDDTAYLFDKGLKVISFIAQIACVALLALVIYGSFTQGILSDHLTMQSTVKFEIDGHVVNAHMSEIIDYYIEKNWLDAIADEGRE